jgi:hypothetical protein
VPCASAAHPFVVVAEEREVEVGRAAVRLRADWQLGQQPLGCLRAAAETSADDRLLEPLLDQPARQRGGSRRFRARLETLAQTCLSARLTYFQKCFPPSLRYVMLSEVSSIPRLLVQSENNQYAQSIQSDA